MNSKGHLMVSFAKSVTRIAGIIITVILALKNNDLHNAIATLALSFGIAEVMGIFEELVDKR